MKRILVIDDQIGASLDRQDALLSSLRSVTGDDWEFVFFSGQISGVNSIEAVLEKVGEGWNPAAGTYWSMILLDVRFDQKTPQAGDGTFGFELLRALRGEFGVDPPIIMLTGEGDNAMLPAQNFVADGFLAKVGTGMDGARFAREFQARFFENSLFPDDRIIGHRMIGESLPFLKFLREARRCAVKEREPLILGETGVGKTEVARLIHDHSRRAKKEFVKHTAQRLNEDLMKSALFGEWKGAHSQSHSAQAGPIERAHEGTFFLDEVALLNPSVQELFLGFRDRKLINNRQLRMITRAGLYPKGGRAADLSEARNSIIGIPFPDLDHLQEIGVDVLLLTATNEPLDEQACREKLQFREDLFQAFGVPITIPPLNERREDIPLLFKHFVEMAGGPAITVEPEVLEQVKAADWSNSNVRGLRREAEQAVSKLSGFDRIVPRYLTANVVRQGPANVVPQAPPPDERIVPIAEIPQHAKAPSDQNERGGYGRAYATFLEERLNLLDGALEATRKQDSGTGESGDYSPTNAVRRMLGVSKLVEKGETAEAKRIIREILKDVLEPKRIYEEVIPAETWLRLRQRIESSEALRTMRDQK